jgi:hypothetical protein
MEKLKKRWHIESNYQLFIILLVFSINGSLAVAIAKPILNSVGITLAFLNPIVFWTMRIILMFIIYQVLLIVIGTLFGQHKFFWNMEKKMLKRLGFKKLLNN